MVIVPHGPRGHPDRRSQLSDPHAPSRNVDVAAGSRERCGARRGRCSATIGRTVPEPAEGDEYRERRTRPLGKPLALPGPFAFDLDTADFL
ncbi:hypothetical protein GCM10022285_05320 [Streptomyces tunisiensis]|uniref:Uncharacterized protein n=1 Tax=Streptomyces tunisiensis TaxID=948699 RepID=A0ABP7XR90_9ACTN